MTRKILIVIVGVICLIVFAALIASNPLRRSEADIKRQILEITPLGTSFSQVRTTVERRGWLGDISGGADAAVISGVIGSYQGIPHRTEVYVMWLFRAEGHTNLTDIYLMKQRVGQ